MTGMARAPDYQAMTGLARQQSVLTYLHAQCKPCEDSFRDGVKVTCFEVPDAEQEANVQEALRERITAKGVDRYRQFLKDGRFRVQTLAKIYVNFKQEPSALTVLTSSYKKMDLKKWGDKLLLAAVEAGLTRVVRFLVETAELDVGVHDNSALVSIANIGDDVMLRELLDLGLDPAVNGDKALEIAQQNGHHAFAQTLLTHGQERRVVTQVSASDNTAPSAP